MCACAWIVKRAERKRSRFCSREDLFFKNKREEIMFVKVLTNSK